MTDHASLPHPTAVRLARYTNTEQREILGGGPDPFGVADAGLTWLAKEHHFGVRQGDRLVAHAGLLRLPLSIGGVDTEVMGVGGVAVAPDVRGRGLARVVLSAALDHARTTGLQHALLFCRPPLVPLYRRLGWCTLEQDVHVEQPGGTVTMPLRTMTTPLRADAHWPDGPVHLRSLPM
ncbi:GNAT family N-acetyltransferase [Streptomyces sp. NBC_01233]|uniref:GNAT family N-acetyltransferase n=1 Tax=Streptomyces sp. NBC_01233 TaxID=2903787 RepID=UPI002E0EED80|nr:GNAT family N-acetyltransferase [Streptomyces sp. NBC_01233]